MVTERARPSATSLPRDPREESDGRVRKYAIMMSVRVVCFILMVTVTPYSWYTWVFALGAAVLPYLAVIVANVGTDAAPEGASSPVRELAAPASDGAANVEPPHVIRITETPPRDPQRNRDGDLP